MVPVESFSVLVDPSAKELVVPVLVDETDAAAVVVVFVDYVSVVVNAVS